MKKKKAIAKMSKYFPEEFLREIFIRLPGRSLLRFRWVSKSCCALIDDPNFHSMHHELSNLKKNTCIMFCENKRKKLYTIDYKSVLSLLPLPASSTTVCDFTNLMNYPYIFQGCYVEFLSACNGLVCFTRTMSNLGEEYYIWNPSTKVFKNIPMAREVDGCNIDGYGFGYDYKTGDYKLVRVVADQESECSNVDLYTSSSNSWKDNRSIPYVLCEKTEIYSGVLFNGALHYPARTFRDDSTVLVCFDIVSEGFEEIALPEALTYPEDTMEEDIFNIDVGELGGFLCLVVHVFKVRVDVWIMQEYGVRESWTKSFSITQKSITSSKYLELIWSFKNNETLWEVDWGLVLFHPSCKIYRKLMLGSHVDERITVAKDYMVSSVSL